MTETWYSLREGRSPETDNQGSGLISDVQGPFRLISRRAPLATLENQYGQIAFAHFSDLVPVRSPGR